MKFEDLLEVYAEVSLPTGWSAVVIPKQFDTTLVYSYLSMTNSEVPYVEKQVFIQSDMLIHCATCTKEIDPEIYGIVEKSPIVESLSFLEDLIHEFDRRRMCDGESKKFRRSKV